MAIIFDGPVTPDALTVFIRQVPSPSDHLLSRLLPDRYLTSNTVDLAELNRTNRTARFRSFDGRLHVSKRDASVTKRVKLPPLSSSVSTGELERLNIEFARLGGGSNASIVNAIYDDATNLTREVQSRMEQARGDVLTDGKFTLAGEGEGGLVMEADYGVPAAHLVAPGTPWSTVATATVLQNLRTWVDVYVTTNGFRPGGFVTSERVLSYMLQNAEIHTLASSLIGAPALVGEQQLSQVLQNFRIPPLLFTYDTKVDVDGVSTSVVPDDRLIFVPPNVADLGYTAWGLSATALELVNSSVIDLSFEEAPGIVGVVEKSGPPYREWTFVDAVGMPVLSNSNLLLVADVA